MCSAWFKLSTFNAIPEVICAHVGKNYITWSMDITTQVASRGNRKMAELSSLLPQLRVSNSYIPVCPPKAPKETSSYSRFLQDAPYSALSGVVGDGRKPERHKVLPRCRERHQVGATNRWRLPESLYSDLLGNAQALKAVNMPYNSTLVRIITGMDPTPQPQHHSWSLPVAPMPPDPPSPQQQGYMQTVMQAARTYTSGAWQPGLQKACSTRFRHSQPGSKDL